MVQLDITLSDSDLSKLADMIVERITAANSGDGTRRLLYPEVEAAEMLGISRNTLKRWRNDGYIQASTSTKPILYSMNDLEAAAEWIGQRRKSR